MKKATYLVAGLLALCALGTDSAAGQEGAWRFQIEAINMGVFGNDVHEATVLTADFNALPAVEDAEGVDVELEDETALRVEIEYMRNQWGWGFDAWWFDTSGAVGRSGLTSPSFPFVTTSVLSEVPGLTDLAPPAGLGELNFNAENQLEVWTADLYAIRTLAEKPASEINMTWGLKFGVLENSRAEVLENTFFPTEVVHGSATESSTLVGPMVALQGRARFGRQRVEGFVSQSVLIGDVDFDALLTFMAGDLVTERVTFTKSETVAIPVTETKFKWLYDVNDRVAVGLGVFASVWWDAPVAPLLAFPPRLEENTIVFAGSMVGLQWRIP